MIKPLGQIEGRSSSTRSARRAPTPSCGRAGTFDCPIRGLPATSPPRRSPARSNERAIGGGVAWKDRRHRSPSRRACLSVRRAPSTASTTATSHGRGLIDARTNGAQLLRAYAVCSATSKATIQVESTFIPNSGTTLNLYVPCPSGQRALAGGVGTMQPNRHSVNRGEHSGKFPGKLACRAPGGIAGGWFARVHHAGQQGGASYRVAAICEGPTPGTTVPPPPRPSDPDDPTPVDPLNPTIATPIERLQVRAVLPPQGPRDRGARVEGSRPRRGDPQVQQVQISSQRCDRAGQDRSQRSWPPRAARRKSWIARAS